MSDRDKKLLVYLGALIIVAAAYFLVGRPFLDKIDQQSVEKAQLETELSQKREALENVMKTEEIQTIEDRLKNIGFTKIIPFYQAFSFKAWAVIK